MSVGTSTALQGWTTELKIRPGCLVLPPKERYRCREWSFGLPPFLLSLNYNSNGSVEIIWHSEPTGSYLLISYMPYYTIRLYGDFVPDSVGPPLLLLLHIMPCDFPSWPFSQSGVTHLFCDSLITVPMRAGAILLVIPVLQYCIPSAKTLPDAEGMIMNLKILIPFILTVKQLRFNLKPPFLKKRIENVFQFSSWLLCGPSKNFR